LSHAVASADAPGMAAAASTSLSAPSNERRSWHLRLPVSAYQVTCRAEQESAQHIILRAGAQDLKKNLIALNYNSQALVKLAHCEHTLFCPLAV
jgi:hypothetical protein